MKSVKLLYEQGKEYLDAENYEKGLPLFLEVLKRQPEHKEANKYIGICYLYTENPPEALKALDRYIRANESDYLFMNYVATVFAHYENMDRAKELFLKALTLTPVEQAGRLYEDVALWLFYESDPEVAAKYLEKSIDASTAPSNKTIEKLNALYQARLYKRLKISQNDIQKGETFFYNSSDEAKSTFLSDIYAEFIPETAIYTSLESLYESFPDDRKVILILFSLYGRDEEKRTVAAHLSNHIYQSPEISEALYPFIFHWCRTCRNQELSALLNIGLLFYIEKDEVQNLAMKIIEYDVDFATAVAAWLKYQPDEFRQTHRILEVQIWRRIQKIWITIRQDEALVHKINKALDLTLDMGEIWFNEIQNPWNYSEEVIKTLSNHGVNIKTEGDLREFAMGSPLVTYLVLNDKKIDTLISGPFVCDASRTYLCCTTFSRTHGFTLIVLNLSSNEIIEVDSVRGFYSPYGYIDDEFVVITKKGRVDLEKDTLRFKVSELSTRGITQRMHLVLSNPRKNYSILEKEGALYVYFEKDRKGSLEAPLVPLRDSAKEEFLKGNLTIFDNPSAFTGNSFSLNIDTETEKSLKKSAEEAIAEYHRAILPYTVPQVDNQNKTWISENRLYSFEEWEWNNFSVKLDKIKALYYHIESSSKKHLILCAYGDNKLKSSSFGFPIVLNYMAHYFGFNADAVLMGLEQNKKGIVEIWKRTGLQTYHFTEDVYNDYHKGFEIQSPETRFVLWDETLQTILQSYSDMIKVDSRNETRRRFIYPVRVGSIVLENFSFYTTQRSRLPITAFYSDCYHYSSTDKSFHELRDKLNLDLLGADDAAPDEKKIQMRFSIPKEEIDFRILYTPFSDMFYEKYFSGFHIENRRKYPELLRNSEYEKNMAVDNMFLLSGHIHLFGDFKLRESMFLRPSGLPCPDKTFIWYDKKNQVTGFAGKEYCHIFKNRDIEKFTLFNVRPAKGGGGAYLRVEPVSQKQGLDVLAGDFEELDAHLEAIEDLVHKKIEIGPESIDC